MPKTMPYPIGTTVTIYQEPITQKRAEGDAVLVRFVRTTFDGAGVYDVRFLDDGAGETYRRTVYPSPD